LGPVEKPFDKMRFWLGLALLLTASASRAENPRTVEVLFTPVAGLQIAVWVEDPQGNYVDTVYVTRLTGSLGLANRPGNGLFKTDFRFPYGRREMVLPVWAHKRNHPYGYVVMGGLDGNSIASCATQNVGSDCDDQTIGYHFAVSSPEPFYCSPRGGVDVKQNGVDVISCASPFYGSKGAYASSGVSYYPPRADLTSFVADHDGPDAMAFSTINDLGAVSGATPPGGAMLSTPIRWTPGAAVADGPYVLRIEASMEADFNSFHNHPNIDDEHAELNSYGHPFLGQPSIVYEVPFTLSETITDTETTATYVGYGAWDGQSGTLNPADPTISTDDGTGAGRLMMNTDATGSWRVQVTALPGMRPTCDPPQTPTGLTLTPGPTSLGLAFASAAHGPPTARFDVRYSDKPLSDANFIKGLPSDHMPPPPGDAGSTVTSLIGGLRPQTKYYVAVQALATCGASSAVTTTSDTTKPASFATLSGCFIATAAYGTPLAAEVEALRRLRDRYLMTNPAGRLAVAVYYAVSPPLARAIAGNDLARAAARAIVRPFVDASAAL
jgi:hypothetical protein